MKVFGKTSTLIATVLAVVCAAGAIAAYNVYEREVQKTQELEEQLDKLTKEEKQSAVMQSINAQMEEIALQERRISEEQREEAIAQTKVAEQMRQHAEMERQNALVAEKRALEASEVAKSQRVIAEHQRTEAEFSKRVADTLSYITLARQLGNVASTQHETGNRELADLLAYASYLFTNRYHGDIYYPTIYQALEQTSQSKHQWKKHQGTITDIAFLEGNKNRLLSCSTYGELLEHSVVGNRLKTDILISDNRFDFRDIFVVHSTNTIYAVSRTGHLVVIQNNKHLLREVTGIGPLLAIEPVGGRMIVFGEKGMALVNDKNYEIEKTRQLPYKCVFVTRYDYAPNVFDNQGGMHIVRGFDKIDDKKVPVTGQVTAFASSKNTGLIAFGMKNGVIYLYDAKGKRYELIGHRSRISYLKINGWQLYSSSYDGMMNIWMANQSKIEPMTIMKNDNWITCFTFDPKKHNIWCGDQKGNLTDEFIAVNMMVERIKGKLKRNLTQAEWNYYIGPNVPYELFIGKGSGQ